MTIHELDENYYFHDSLLDEIIVDKQNSTVSLRIDFCFWAQNGYKNEDPETGMIVLRFTGVKKYPEIEGELDSYSILNTSCLQDGSWYVFLLDDFTDTCYEFTILSDDVSFVVENNTQE